MANYVNLLDIVYPVNSMYFSFSSTSPSSIVGGIWTQLSNRVIRAGADISTGGLDTQSKNFNHNHYMSLYWNGNATMGTTANKTGFNIHLGDASCGTSGILTSDSSIPSGKAWGADLSTSYQAKPLSTVTWNNLPAYQNCYIWYRTA